ncbi:diadenosine tetraphosphate (Ap4A) HIT family hydrolase [Bacillus pakistanensis]|uniref:Diadenosine tetraphosphate (Ap4A) HIT family hydrolase n=1 Tax=Rossellomorea pakistanensis TaxID=992288 RepID=A0ABS2N7D0_9BACI|nr:HIT family protein [Bacillus pakistanensis]MBM7583724.1 diadenosine tetraphosphate (Ap4A) HIT family hydrolase [Bacillus pakistanensis]
MGEACFICDKHLWNIETTGPTIYEDEYVYVGPIDKDGRPSYLGHLMIDLKRHVPTLADMNMEEAKPIRMTIVRVSKALVHSENGEHIYSLVSGNSVPHLHMHIVPRYPSTPKEYWGPMSVYDWPDAPMDYNTEIIEICNRVKSYIECERNE